MIRYTLKEQIFAELSFAELIFAGTYFRGWPDSCNFAELIFAVRPFFCDFAELIFAVGDKIDYFVVHFYMFWGLYMTFTKFSAIFF